LVYSIGGLSSLVVSIIMSFGLIIAIGNHGPFYSLDLGIQILLLAAQISSFYFGIIFFFRNIVRPFDPKKEPRKYAFLVLLVVSIWLFLSMFCEMYPFALLLMLSMDVLVAFPLSWGMWFLIPVYFLLRFLIVRKTSESV